MGFQGQGPGVAGATDRLVRLAERGSQLSRCRGGVLASRAPAAVLIAPNGSPANALSPSIPITPSCSWPSRKPASCGRLRQSFGQRGRAPSTVLHVSPGNASVPGPGEVVEGTDRLGG